MRSPYLLSPNPIRLLALLALALATPGAAGAAEACRKPLQSPEERVRGAIEAFGADARFAELGRGFLDMHERGDNAWAGDAESIHVAAIPRKAFLTRVLGLVSARHRAIPPEVTYSVAISMNAAPVYYSIGFTIYQKDPGTPPLCSLTASKNNQGSFRFGPYTIANDGNGKVGMTAACEWVVENWSLLAGLSPAEIRAALQAVFEEMMGIALGKGPGPHPELGEERERFYGFGED